MNTISRRVVLIGFMGAGKTAVGESLAQRFNCRMIDLDTHITAHEGRSPGEIIDAEGEQRFRELETRALIDVLGNKAAYVIALGGGTWTLERNRALISQHDCLTVWLDAPFELCWQRITREGALRPLARDRERSHKLYHLRQASYALAMARIGVTNQNSIEDVTAKLIKLLRTS